MKVEIKPTWEAKPRRKYTWNEVLQTKGVFIPTTSLADCNGRIVSDGGAVVLYIDSVVVANPSPFWSERLFYKQDETVVITFE